MFGRGHLSTTPVDKPPTPLTTQSERQRRVLSPPQVWNLLGLYRYPYRTFTLDIITTGVSAGYCFPAFLPLTDRYRYFVCHLTKGRLHPMAYRSTYYLNITEKQMQLLEELVKQERQRLFEEKSARNERVVALKNLQVALSRSIYFYDKHSAADKSKRNG